MSSKRLSATIFNTISSIQTHPMPIFFRPLSLICISVTLAFSHSAGAEWLLATQTPHVSPGSQFEVIIIAPSGADEWAERMNAQIELPNQGPRIAIELAAVPAQTDTSRRRYVGQWPTEVNGIATLTLLDMPSSQILYDATPPLTEKQEALTSLRPPSVDRVAAVTPQTGSETPVEPSALGFHEPMYFVVGGKNPHSARFQLSFRYRLFDSQSFITEKIPLVSGLYFGYTQTSVWDLSSDSKPFRDTSFRPSFFYQWRLTDPETPSSLTLAGGYEHESNGRDKEESRSIDTLFAQADARYYLNEGPWYFGVTPKVWAYLDKDDNPDIARYRGYGQLGVRFGRDDGWLASALFRSGTNTGKRATQIDLSYPIRRSIFSGVGAFVHLQYFQGYGETLLDYNRSTKPQFRVGLSFVR